MTTTTTTYRSRTTRDFREALARMPAHIQRLARDNFRAWLKAPFHPRFGFHPLDIAPGFWRVDVGQRYRAIARRTDSDAFQWVWIGSHESYNKQIQRLRR